MTDCRICGNESGNFSYEVPEQLAATGEIFRYIQCALCGCLQIEEIPSDLGKHYDGVYYSFAPPKFSLQERIARWYRDEYCLRSRGTVGRLLSDRMPNGKLEILRHAGISPGSRILDIGAGSGYFLGILWDHGFRNVEGVDPFIPHDVEFRPGAKVRKAGLEDTSGKWDFVVFNHSLEHMVDPFFPLERARDLLTDSGKCIVRIPVCSGSAWEIYREHWASIDAPRHIYLHSRESFRRVVDRSGLRIAGELYDSEAFQFWASEQGRKGIPHKASNAAAKFSGAEMREFARRAADMNRICRGDQVGYILQLRS
jgi:SAM-dependent methyltransferase